MQTNNTILAMKKILLILVFILTSALSYNGYAQGPPPPPGGSFGGQSTGGGHGQGGNKGPAGAPVGGGLEILLVLGLAYAGKKVYKFRQEKEEE
jgi:hypothetical protein